MNPLTRKYPAVCPTELQVEAWPTLWRLSMVSAQPSTAMSCVAARKFRKKNMHVRVSTSGARSSPPRYFSTLNDIANIVKPGKDGD